MCASGNGRPRTRSGSGPTARRRWTFASPLSRRQQARARAGFRLRAGRTAGARRRARRRSRPDAARPRAATSSRRWPRRSCTTRRERAEPAAVVRAARRCPRSCCCRDLWAPIERSARDDRAALGAPARTATSCRSSIRPRRAFPFAAASSSSSRGRRQHHRRARRGLARRLPGSARRATAPTIRAETDRRGWSFAIHRTDRPASELLLVLHSRMGDDAQPVAPAAGTRTAAQRAPHDRPAARLRRSRWCCSACSACRCSGGCCGSCRRARAASIFRRRASCSTSRPKEETPARTPWWLTLLRLTLARARDHRRRRADVEPAARDHGPRRAPLLSWSTTAGPRPRPGTRGCAPPTR